MFIIQQQERHWTKMASVIEFQGEKTAAGQKQTMTRFSFATKKHLDDTQDGSSRIIGMFVSCYIQCKTNTALITLDR